MSSLIAYAILGAVVISAGIFIFHEPRNDAGDDNADGDRIHLPPGFISQHDKPLEDAADRIAKLLQRVKPRSVG